MILGRWGERPDWWPAWEPGKYLRVASHHQVWNEATDAAVKAVIERVETLMGTALINNSQTIRFIHDDIWQDLRKEAGLE